MVIWYLYYYLDYLQKEIYYQYLSEEEPLQAFPQELYQALDPENQKQHLLTTSQKTSYLFWLPDTQDQQEHPKL